MTGDQIQKLADSLGDSNRRVRSDYHLTLGKAIKIFADFHMSYPVRFDHGDTAPGVPASDRGYYSDLAFPSRETCTAGEFLTMCQNALNKTYEGYKGGVFVMGADTPLWSAEWGSTGRAIMGIEVRGEQIILITKDVN